MTFLNSDFTNVDMTEHLYSDANIILGLTDRQSSMCVGIKDEHLIIVCLVYSDNRKIMLRNYHINVKCLSLCNQHSFFLYKTPVRCPMYRRFDKGRTANCKCHFRFMDLRIQTINTWFERGLVSSSAR